MTVAMFHAHTTTQPADRSPLDGPTLAIERLEVHLGTQLLRLETSCVLRAGRLYLLWGPSGSGKSSFARALLGLGDLAHPPVPASADMVLTDAQGKQHVLWQAHRYHAPAREQIAFFPQAEKLGFLDHLSTTDNLRLFSRLSRDDATDQIRQLAHRFHLTTLPRRVAQASGGERMRLSAIRGLLPRTPGTRPPPLAIADEPTSGLDPAAASALAREFVELARRGDSIVVIITHDPRYFLGPQKLIASTASERKTVRILECEVGPQELQHPHEIARLRLESDPRRERRGWSLARRWADKLQWFGAIALSPWAFLEGLLRMRRPALLLRQILSEMFGPGTQFFSLFGCLLIAATASYFIFRQMPRPELIEPLLMPEILQVTGHTLVRVVLPLAACALVTAKLGAAQAARLAAAVRGGLRETLALARWRVEAFGLVPAVVAQMAAMLCATIIAIFAGLGVAALIYLGNHPASSLDLTISLMVSGLDEVADWKKYLLAKILLSGFLGGAIAAMFGLAPAGSEEDVATAVHRTLLWSVLCVIGCQCALIIAEFARS